MAVRDARVRPDQLIVPSGWSLLITDPLGRICGASTAGFYVDNTRVMSRERIAVDGREISPFSCVRVGPAGLAAHVELGDGETLPPEAMYAVIERFIGAGLRTRLRFFSYADEDASFSVTIDVCADFADIDEALTSERRQVADVDTTWDDARKELRMEYCHPGLSREVRVRFESGTPRHAADGVHVDLVVPARGTATVEYLVEATVDGQRRAAPHASFGHQDDSAGRARAQILREATGLQCTNADVAAAWRTAIDDFAALPMGEPDGPAAPIAGLPLYQQIFGRDMLTASWQALLATPTPLRDSLRLMAARVGRRVDDWRDEEPGKMLHQARRGPIAALGEDPLSAYYGDWATVPDFLVFLGQYYAWTGDMDTVFDLVPVARQALTWMQRLGDPDKDGFLEYQTHSPAGVKNQGWKDSDDAVVDAGGEPVPNPLATSELQAYQYAALRHIAPVLAAVGDRAFAVRLWRQSRVLQQRFDAAFWMPEHSSYAMALDADKRQVRSVTSNDGHLLASGIVPHGKARRVARRLMAPDMFSGWGIRTLSADHPAFNPFSYHRGSVWPVEQATTALGFARYGQWDELHTLAEGVFAAAGLFAEHRLPETISGLPRTDADPYPAAYPQSCSPQAWSASCIVALIQAMLGLRPAAPARTVLVDPHLPSWLPDVTLTGLQIGPVTATLHARRRANGASTVRIVEASGPLAVVSQPARQARTSVLQRAAALRRSRFTPAVR